jgi:hypothetical protein
VSRPGRPVTVRDVEQSLHASGLSAGPAGRVSRMERIQIRRIRRR